MSDSELSRIDAIATDRELKKGEELFAEGSIGDDFSIVRKGGVGIFKKVAGGRKRNLTTFPPGKAFGELSLFDNQSRSAQAEAVEDTTIVSFKTDRFKALLDSDPVLASKFQKAIILLLCKRLRESNEKLNQGVIWGFKTQA